MKPGGKDQLNSNILKQYSDLVGGLDHFLFSHILGIIIPIDELIFFRGVGQPPTRWFIVAYIPLTWMMTGYYLAATYIHTYIHRYIHINIDMVLHT